MGCWLQDLTPIFLVKKGCSIMKKINNFTYRKLRDKYKFIKREKNTEAYLKYKLYIMLAIYTGIVLVLMFMADYTFSNFSNPLVKWLKLRRDVLFFLVFIIGYITIFNFYWKKPWNYLREIINATHTIYQQNDELVELSKPLKEIEQQMNQIKMSVLLSQQAVKEAENKKNNLVMYLAHDIRTPLTSVIGYLSLLKEIPNMDNSQKSKYTEVALDKAQYLEKLINELFEITRYNSNQIKINFEKVDLYYMLLQLKDEFYPLLSEKGNRAILKANESLTIKADSEKLARVFNNILKNAIAYSYPNTEIIISAVHKDSKVDIAFRNYGQTIPEEQLSAIFEKFNRLDEARKSDMGGAGLGLSIAKEIINLHGGDITVQSKDEVTTFTISLPTSI
ncbi:sensor protein [Clostridioides difficile R20291]|uniref:histidine kinase n=4 Tax=Clostridioides difficile TaxID=1496 RepID=A0A9R0CFX3_CLODR|nr:sensor protein [Clostridioides difficile CD196]CBE06962.1 sensor protein [Clostridioides difficile R20291]